MIWEAAVPGPRIVTIRQKALDITLHDWIEQLEEEDGSENVRCGSLYEVLENKMVGITSNCAPPQMLSACREAHNVASKYYKQAFEMEAA